MQKYTKSYRELISEYTDKTNKADALIVECLGITPECKAIINMLSKESVMDPSIKPVNAILNVVKNIVSYLEGATSKDVAVSKDITVVKEVAGLLTEAVVVLNERIETEQGKGDKKIEGKRPQERLNEHPYDENIFGGNTPF